MCNAHFKRTSELAQLSVNPLREGFDLPERTFQVCFQDVDLADKEALLQLRGPQPLICVLQVFSHGGDLQL